MTFTSRQVDVVTPVSFAAGKLFWGVACSNTYYSVNGYAALGSSAGAFRQPTYETGGGALYRWYEPGNSFYRDLFESVWDPPGAVWWQHCIRAGEGGATNYEVQAATAAAWLLSVVGDDTPVWVSPVNTYEEPSPGRPSQLTSAAHHIAIRDYVLGLSGPAAAGWMAGPLLGPLSSAMTTDGTHPNGTGRAFVGAQLRDFFDPFVT
jgi:hypothetical protein